MQKDLISVIVPVYNVEVYVERCVKSILGQTYPQIEVVLVDDGSKDSSGRICDELARADSRIKVIHQENQGLGPARNTGLDNASGEFVTFVDSDDWVEPDAYRTMHASLVANSCDIATCGRNIVSGDKVIKNYFCLSEGIRIEKPESIKRFLLQQDLNMSACDKLYRAFLFKDVRFPGDHLVSEDIVPIYTVLKKASGVYLTGKPFYNYYYREGSLSKSAFNRKLFGAYIYSKCACDDVRKEFPELKKAAEYFEMDIKITIYRNMRGSRYTGEEAEQIYSELKRDCPAAMKNRYLSYKQKIYILLAILKMDRIPNAIYGKYKQRK